jgi:hypothetical protein
MRRITEADLIMRHSAAFDLCVALGFCTPETLWDFVNRWQQAKQRGDLTPIQRGQFKLSMDLHNRNVQANKELHPR